MELGNSATKAHRALLGDYLVDLYGASSPEAEFQITVRYVTQLGFDGLLYCYIPSLLVDKKLAFDPVFNVSDSYSAQFLTHYEEAGFAEHDFAIKRVVTGQADIIDWWQEEKRNTINDQEKEVILVAREDYGIRNGITLPTMINNVGFAGASLISESSTPGFSLLSNESLATAKIIVQTYHNKLFNSPRSQQKFILPVLDRLNDTDRKVLKYLIRHKTMSRVKDVTGVSFHYANRVVERLRSKLGDISRNELVYYAGLLNLLEFLD